MMTDHYTTSRDRDDLRETNLLKDVAFNRHSMNDGEHISPLDNGQVNIGTDNIHIKLIQGIPEDQFKKVMSMATRATIGIDLSSEPIWERCNTPIHQICNDPRLVGGPFQTHRELLQEDGKWYREHRIDPTLDNQDWEEMLRGGLQTALEDFVLVFAISGVSRTCTHQLVRSSRVRFHQQSQRASFYGSHPEVRMPESVWRNPHARQAFLFAIEAAHTAYRVACDEDISYQDARYVLPEGTDNYILWEGTIREFLAVYAYRACSMFSWEIVHCFREMGKLLVETHPWMAPYVKISCENVGRCTFQGWEQVEGQCDFPWAQEDNRTFKSQFHSIKRKDA
jgi:hypothetical protein